MDAVKCIGSDLYGEDENPFRSLKTLCLGPMRSLEEWGTLRGREIFSGLHELSVKKCPMLVKLPMMPSVQKLKIEDCSVTLLRSVMNFTSIASLYIWSFDELTLLPEGLLKNNKLLESLDVYKLGSLKSLSNQLDHLSSLKRLELRYCDELESLTEDLQNLNPLEFLNLVSLPITGLSGLPSVSTLWIQDCEELTSLSEGLQYPMALKDLFLSGCPELKSLPESIQLLTSLQSLSIMDCEGLCCLPNQIGHLVSLTQLIIWNCPKLKSFPDSLQSLIMLRELRIEDCPNLQKRTKKEKGEDWPKIAHIPTIIVNGQLLQSSEA